MSSFLLLLIILATSRVTLPTSPNITTKHSSTSFLPVQSYGLNGALQWLASNQSSSGSYGDYREHWGASAAYALWLNNSGSAKAELSYSYLARQLNSSSTWFWGTYGEADVPGTVLFGLASSSHLGLINTTAVAAGLLQFQQSTGGFRGYYDPNKSQTVTSSVDTDMALLGLIDSNSIPVKNQTFAARYLLSLQNADGSFNLTSSTSFDPIYSLAPDPVSITALTVLTLKSDGFTTENPTISNALKFLSGVALGLVTGQTARLRLRSIFSRSKIAMEVSAIPAVPPPTQNRMLWIRDGHQLLLKRNPRKKEARPAQLTVPQWPLSLSLLKHPQ